MARTVSIRPHLLDKRFLFQELTLILSYSIEQGKSSGYGQPKKKKRSKKSKQGSDAEKAILEEHEKSLETDTTDNSPAAIEIEKLKSKIMFQEQ